MIVGVMAHALLRLRPRSCFPRGVLTVFGLCALLLRPIAATLATSEAATCIVPHGAQSGDLIFRKGTEAVSDLVRSLDQCASLGGDGEFSHVGLLIAASDLSVEFIGHAHELAPCESAWFVLHATPSEVAGRTDSVVLDSFSFFISPKLSKGHAIYRITDTETGQRRAAMNAALAQLGQPFSLTDENGTYCTELPYAAWLSAEVDLDVRFKHLAIFLFAPRDFLFPSALMASPKLERLGEG